jgi:hypothetical protein
MTEQALMRYFFTIILVAGLVIMSIALADRLWLVGLIMIVVGGVVGGVLWKWYLDEQAEAREARRLRPESARKAPSQPEA